MSAARWPLALALLTSCASTVTGTTGASDAALDAPLSDIVGPADVVATDHLPDHPDDGGGVDPLCPQRPCRVAPLLRAAMAATWLIYPDGRTIYWGSWASSRNREGEGLHRYESPVQGPRLGDDIVDVAMSIFHGCALAVYPRRVICWGDNDFGQLGHAASASAEPPSIVAGLSDVAAIGALGQSSWALSGSGAFRWGTTNLLELRDVFDRPTRIPFTPTGASRFATGGTDRSFGFLTSDRAVYPFGENAYGSAGSDSDAAVTVPTRLTGLTDVIDYHAAATASCAVVTSGAVYCWGQRAGVLARRGELPEGTARPELVPGINDATRVYVGSAFACVLTRTQTVRCWGAVNWDPPDSSIGANDFLPPGPPMDLPPVRELALGLNHACALTMADEVYCWGHNGAAQLGIPRFYANSNRPRRVPLPQ